MSSEPRWKAHFEAYEGVNVDDQPCSINADIVAAIYAPLASHPLRVEARVALRSPTEDGLATEVEEDKLYAALKPMTRVLRKEFDAIPVADEVRQGALELVLYMPRRAKEKRDEIVRLFEKHLGKATSSWVDDP